MAEDPKDWYIAEISSFQLDDISSFRPEVAILTNITEDHLDRYEYRFENYIRSKFRIVENQTKEDYFIYCEDDPVTKQYINQYTINSNPLPFTMQHETNKGGSIRNGQMVIQAGSEKVEMSIYDFALKGIHKSIQYYGSRYRGGNRRDPETKNPEAIQSFESLEHRTEYVSTVRGVEFINDSKAY